MNRDALRAAIPSGCVQPVRGHYGAVRRSTRRRPWSRIRLRSLALIAVLGGLAALAYVLVSGAMQPRPSLRILAPLPDTVIAGGRTTVVVEVENAQLSASNGHHLHYYLDAVVPTARGKPAIPASGTWTSTTKTTQDWDLTGEGLHVLAVQLVDAGDRPLDPPVVAAVVVTVPRSLPAPPPASPQPPTPGK